MVDAIRLEQQRAKSKPRAKTGESQGGQGGRVFRQPAEGRALPSSGEALEDGAASQQSPFEPESGEAAPPAKKRRRRRKPNSGASGAAGAAGDDFVRSH